MARIGACDDALSLENCYADVLTSKHDITIESYFNDVIAPALATIDGKIEALSTSDWPGDVFAHDDMKDMQRESKLAFGLAIQSIWERQLRAYSIHTVPNRRRA